MLRKKKGEGTSRRARLDIEDGDGTAYDPIAAALEDRKKKQGTKSNFSLSTADHTFQFIVQWMHTETCW